MKNGHLSFYFVFKNNLNVIHKCTPLTFKIHQAYLGTCYLFNWWQLQRNYNKETSYEGEIFWNNRERKMNKWIALLCSKQNEVIYMNISNIKIAFV